MKRYSFLLTIAGLCVAYFVLMYFVSPVLVLSREDLKSHCFKPIQQENYEAKNYDNRSGYDRAVPPPSQSSNNEPGRIDEDCLIAEYTKTLALFTLWLVGATALLGFATLMAARAAQRAAEPGFVIGPNELRFPAHAACAWWGWREGCVFYGRIWFTDTFDSKTERYSGFILDIDSGHTAVMNRPKYWART